MCNRSVNRFGVGEVKSHWIGYGQDYKKYENDTQTYNYRRLIEERDTTRRWGKELNFDYLGDDYEV